MAPLVKKGMIETAPISKENPVRLASRASQLAMAQTHEVARRLDQGPDQIACAIEALSTRGDEVLDRSLAELGGKGLFVKTLEAAMLDGRAEAAVHSALQRLRPPVHVRLLGRPLRQVADEGGEAVADFVRFRREARNFLHDDLVEVAR